MYILVFLFFSSFQTNECYDRFVVCGENYIEKRDNFVKAALNQDAKRIIVLIDNLHSKNRKFIFVRSLISP
jgi:hypothetical protein